MVRRRNDVETVKLPSGRRLGPGAEQRLRADRKRDNERQ
jgi:hypothetical protein